MSKDNYIQQDLFSSYASGDFKGEKRFLFSYSKMSLYTECPLKYKFKYEDKLPEKPKYFFAFGQVMHEMLELFHKTAPAPSLPDLINEFFTVWNRKSWQEKGYPNIEKHEEDFLKGKNILEKYYEKHSSYAEIPFLIEYKTQVEIDGLNVIVIADKIEYIGKGLIRIVDYKTGKPASRTPEQLYLYQKICENDKNLIKIVSERKGENLDRITVDSLLYYYIEQLDEKVYKRATEDEIKKFWQKALEIADNIKSGKFEPTPSQRSCAFCDFKHYCPVFSNKPQDLRQMKKSQDDDISELLESYADILIKKEELEKKLIEKIPEGRLDWEGSSFSISIEKRKIYDYKDRSAVIETLKEQGLYESVLSPTRDKVYALLNSKDLKPQQVQALSKHFVEKYEIKKHRLEKK